MSKPSPNFTPNIIKEQDNKKIRNNRNSTENYKFLNPRPLHNQINDINNYLNNNSNNSLLKKQFKKPPLIGLKNIEAYCYMNPILQCFCQIESLVNYFKYDKMVDNAIEKYKNKNCLTKSFKILIENLWPTSDNKYIKKKYLSKYSNNTYFIPEEFKETISKMNPLFEDIYPKFADAKDLPLFIIETLHDELNEYKDCKYMSDFNFDRYNQDSALNYFKMDFSRTNKSIISDKFYGIVHSVTKCSNCLIDRHIFQIYYFLIFPLEEVREYKLKQSVKNQNLMEINQNNFNIFDCFEYDQRQVIMDGDNKPYCNNCNATFPATCSTYLYTAPSILILVLNRGKRLQFKIKLEFYTELNLSKFIQSRANNENIIYDLIGVVTHIEESGSNGYFIATCKSPIDSLWYQYDDDLVSRVDNFTDQVLNYAFPNILFYQKKP